MQSYYVEFKSGDEMVEFVKEAEKCPFKVELKQGADKINGKSIIGVFSCGICNRLCMNINEQMCPQFLRAIDFCLCC